MPSPSSAKWIKCSCNQLDFILSKINKKNKNAGSCNDLTLGKAVSNTKENGYHLLAQPKESNVHATSYPNENPLRLYDPNPYPETVKLKPDNLFASP